jgi:hypothetical protein
MADDMKIETEPTDEHENEHKHDSTESPEKITGDAPEPKEKPMHTSKLKKLHEWVCTHKKFTIPAGVILVLAVLAAVPVTRFAIAGLFWKQDFPVVVVDSETHKPVSSASVMLQGKLMHTDNKGKVVEHVKVGKATLAVSKQYYKAATATVTVSIMKPKAAYQITLQATGRQVPVTVVNKISGKPVSNAVIVAAKTQVRTDAKGEAVMVLPSGAAEYAVSISLNGYNTVTGKIKVTTQTDPANTFRVTPVGKLYFLSNASGKLDVIKSDLDGQNRQVVLAGTGNEEKTNTVLLASRDWKHVALLSKRDGGTNAKLFLIETTDNDKLTTMDEGDASFALLGWSGDRFVYTVTRNQVPQGQPKRQALKSYQASTDKIVALDETSADSNGTEVIADSYILGSEVVYVKNRDSNRLSTFNSVQSDGTQKKVIKTYQNAPNGYGYSGYLETKPAEFNEIYLRHTSGSDPASRDEYVDGKIAASTISDSQYNDQTYLTFIVSPSGNKTFWTDFRDGKNVFFVGDVKGENGKQLPGSSDDYAAYGWYTDDYLLVTKKGSEMFIMPVDGLPGGIQKALKISDYYKPNYFIRGYGYGYGG